MPWSRCPKWKESIRFALMMREDWALREEQERSTPWCFHAHKNGFTLSNSEWRRGWSFVSRNDVNRYWWRYGGKWLLLRWQIVSREHQLKLRLSIFGAQPDVMVGQLVLDEEKAQVCRLYPLENQKSASSFYVKNQPWFWVAQRFSRSLLTISD